MMERARNGQRKRYTTCAQRSNMFLTPQRQRVTGYGASVGTADGGLTPDPPRFCVETAALGDEAVAETPDCHDLFAHIAKLAAQPADVVVDRAVETVVVTAPDALDQELAIEGAPGIRGEQQ